MGKHPVDCPAANAEGRLPRTRAHLVMDLRGASPAEHGSLGGLP